MPLISWGYTNRSIMRISLNWQFSKQIDNFPNQVKNFPFPGVLKILNWLKINLTWKIYTPTSKICRGYEMNLRALAKFWWKKRKNDIVLSNMCYLKTWKLCENMCYMKTLYENMCYPTTLYENMCYPTYTK